MSADTAPAMPAPIARLPRDRHGRPVPWFVQHDTVTGEIDFRVVGEGKLREAHVFDLCWVCGTRRGRHAAFVIGPMCGINRVSAEPPSHLDCAIYSARACPFLSTPSMRRRTTGLPDLGDSTAGCAITRNPGVALVWSSRTWEPYRVPEEFVAAGAGAGAMWDIGEPTAVRWYAHGRDATRAEVESSIESGLPLFAEQCRNDRDRAELQRMREALVPWLPAGARA